jgi:hypothetical protein
LSFVRIASLPSAVVNTDSTFSPDAARSPATRKSSPGLLGSDATTAWLS